MRKNYKLRLASFSMAVLMLGSVVAPAFTVGAAEVIDTKDPVIQSVSGSYNGYIADKTDYQSAVEDIELTVDKAVCGKDIELKSDVKGKNALVWKEGTGKAEWTFTVPENAYYNLKLVYASVEAGVDFTFGVLVDGKFPFEEAELLSFPRLWMNAESEIKTDNLGNQLSPEQKEIEGYAEGLAKSVIVVSTSDEPAIKRALSCYTATAIAEYFRDQGKDVLLLMDSLTRFAQAKREVGLAAGEPAAARGYPPSVFAAMAPLLERAGRTERGSITAFYTVLVEGDDENEPVADTVRGLLDGHVWLSRKIAQSGRFPAIDILKSVSRLANELADSKLRRAAKMFRQALAAYTDSEDLISIGAYKHGTNPMVDDAIRLRPAMLDFLQQNVDDQYDFNASKERLERIFGE